MIRLINSQTKNPEGFNTHPGHIEVRRDNGELVCVVTNYMHGNGGLHADVYYPRGEDFVLESKVVREGSELAAFIYNQLEVEEWERAAYSEWED